MVNVRVNMNLWMDGVVRKDALFVVKRNDYDIIAG